MSEYPTTRKEWLFAIILGSSIATAGIDLTKYLFVKVTSNEFDVKLHDIACYKDSCEFIVENMGDESGVIRDLMINGDTHKSFYTTHPAGISKNNIKHGNNVSAAAFLKPYDVAEISVRTKLSKSLEKVCFNFKNKSKCYEVNSRFNFTEINS